MTGKPCHIGVLSYTSLSVSLSEALMEELNQGLRPLKQNAEKKFCSRSMHVNNNNNNIITDFNNTSHLGSTCPSTTSHTAVLVELKELRVLYRHDKSICNLSEVDKLGALPFLHGSTMENEGSYRGYVIAALPHLLTSAL
uniref:Uncharacterized protein n=1 Tax=Oncorhynchus tshawytscha TaxID=74940 RepID=A0A8C8IZH3_ONCTS